MALVSVSSRRHPQSVRRDVDAQIEVIAARQAGTFTDRDVHDVGGDRFLVKRRVDAGRWLRRPAGTFVLAGVPPSLDQARHLALLAAGDGARLTHESAAELHRIDGVVRGRIVVSVAHTRRIDVPGVVVHRVDDLTDLDAVSVAGFPTTTPARTILDLASVLSSARLRRAVDHGITDHLTTFTELGAVLARVRRRGKPGVRRLVAVLDALDGEPPPASELERHLASVARRAGVQVVRQFPLPWASEPIRGCVDAAIPASRLILEADGRSWHGRLDDMAKDRRRDRAALRAGWETLRFVYADLVGDPAGAADDIRVVHQRRLRA